MKNILKNISLIALLISAISGFGQVNVSISGMNYISGTPISNCGNIDFGTNSTVRIQFAINLTKQSTQVVGVSNLYVYSLGSSGSRIERKNEIVQPISFDSSFSSSADITMNSSDFNTSGGTLFAIFKTSSGVEYQTSCNYTITKTQLPVFNLSPTSTNVACGSTSPVTFSVANVYNSPGTLTYLWNTSGWSGTVNSSLSSVTLTPSSTTSFPSNVSVTPYLNGVAQPTRTCTINRLPFSSSATITGNNSSCTIGSSSIYTINAGMGNTVTWSSSNTAIATVTGGTNSQVNVNSIANGTCNLIATIINSCGQITTVTKPLKIGAPYFEIVIASTGGGRMDLELKGVNSTTGILENISTQNLTSILWEVVSTNPSGCSTFFPTGTTAKLYYSSSTCRTQLKVTATNSCGSSTIYRPFIGSGGGIQRQALTQNTFQVFPNPAKDIINIELLNKNEQSIKQSRISAELYDMMGIKKSSISIIDFSANINVSNLKKGIYVLKIDIDGQIENHQVIIE